MQFDQIIGFRRDGRPIFVIRGASEAPPEKAGDDQGSDGEKPKSSEGSGESKRETGKTPEDFAKLQAALDKEREARKLADKRAKEGDGFRAKVEEIEAASKSEMERAVDAARKEGESAATQRANARLVSAEARALAAQAQFRDAGDAVRFLDLSDIEVAEDGSVDTASLNRQLEALAKDKPYLLAEEKPTRPSGDVGQGPREPNQPAVTPGMERLREAYATARPK